MLTHVLVSIGLFGAVWSMPLLYSLTVDRGALSLRMERTDSDDAPPGHVRHPFQLTCGCLI